MAVADLEGERVGTLEDAGSSPHKDGAFNSSITSLTRSINIQDLFPISPNGHLITFSDSEDVKQKFHTVVLSKLQRDRSFRTDNSI